MIGHCTNPDDTPDMICPVCDELLVRDLLGDWTCLGCGFPEEQLKEEATDKDSLTVGATTEESSVVQSASSGGSGGISTYGGKGLGIAVASLPPETRITVNGKTFCLADIDKEMTK